MSRRLAVYAFASLGLLLVASLLPVWALAQTKVVKPPAHVIKRNRAVTKEDVLIGTWTSTDPKSGIVADVTLEPRHRFSSTGHSRDALIGWVQGKWFLRKNALVWVYDNSPSAAEDVNPIVEFAPNRFTLKEKTGSLTTYTRIAATHGPFSHYNLAFDNMDDCAPNVRNELKSLIKDFDPDLGFTCEAGLAGSLVSSPNSPLSRDPLGFVRSHLALFGLAADTRLDLRSTGPGGVLQLWKGRPVAGASTAWGIRHNLISDAPYFHLDARLANLESGAPSIAVFVDEAEAAWGKANAGIRMGIRITQEGTEGYRLHIYLQNVSSESVVVPYFPEASGRLAALGLNERPSRPSGSKVVLISEASLAPGESLSFVHAIEASAAPWLGGGGLLRVIFDPTLFAGGSVGLWKYKIESGETRLDLPEGTAPSDAAFAGWWVKTGGRPRNEAFLRYLKKSLADPEQKWPHEAYLKAAAVFLRAGDWPAVIAMSERRNGAAGQRDDLALALAGMQKSGPWPDADAAFRRILKPNTPVSNFERDILLSWKGPTVTSPAFVQNFRKDGEGQRHRAFGESLLRQGRAGLAMVELERANALGDTTEGLYVSLLESERLSGDGEDFKRTAAVARATHPNSNAIRKATDMRIATSPTAANAARYPQWLAWSVPMGQQVAGDLSSTNVVWSKNRLVYIRDRGIGNAQIRSLDLDTGRLAWDADLDQGIPAAERFNSPERQKRYRMPGRVVAENGKIGIAYVEMLEARWENGVLWLDAETGNVVNGEPQADGFAGLREAVSQLQKHPLSSGLKTVNGLSLTAYAAGDGVLFAVDAHRRLSSIDYDSGELRETLPLDAECHHLLQTDGDAIAVLEGGEVIRTDGKTLKTIWKKKLGLKPVTAPAIQGGDLLTLDGRFLSGMSLATGAMRWRYPARDNSAIAAPGPAAAVWTGFDSRIIGVRPPEGFEGMRAGILDAARSQEDGALAEEILETALDADPSNAQAYLALTRLSQKITLSPEAQARLEGYRDFVVATAADTDAINVAAQGHSPVLWSARTGRATGLAADAQRVYVLGHDALRALEVGTGKEAWSLALGVKGGPYKGYEAGRLSLDNGVLYVVAGQATLKAVDARDGRVIWSRALPPTPDCCSILQGLRAFGTDVYLERVVYEGNVARFEFLRVSKADGAVRWTSKWEPELRQYAYVASPSALPSFAKRAVFFATETGGLRALERGSGKTLWTHQLPKDADQSSRAFGDPVSDERAVYAAGADDAIYAFNATTGKILWRSIQGGGKWGDLALGTLMKAGDRLYFGHNDNSIMCLNAIDGTVLWKRAGFFIQSPPVDLNGLLWVASGTTVSALDPATGELRAEQSFPFVRYSERLSTDGRYLYLNHEDGVVQIQPFVSGK